eukprot:CAMPEP_0115331478 /NCGR_PEP_ID=MMETSP0270-20121206/86338_1 /TAXON_ID=71861 /ORGANISM="Scrippsiella trochoidea, Strain CCMP3099" /LENGTH=146 /DNA_ID=CAMNT_0002752275 /DNA_START=38 /DNA_END=475 /DNA_ORIENTATION=-
MITRLLASEFKTSGSPDVVGFDVKGADVVAKYNSLRHEMQHPCVIIGRSGSTAEVLAGLPGYDKQSPTSLAALAPECFFVEEELPGDVSSTKLRAALDASDEVAISSFCPRRVGEYLLQVRGTLYAEACSDTSSGDVAAAHSGAAD